MRVSHTISLALPTAIYANELCQPTRASTSDATITPAPQIPIELLRKQLDNRFMGWLSYSGEWITRQCDIGGTLYQSGDYWRCCATTIASCNVPVGCISGSLIYSFTEGTESVGTYACTSIYSDPEDSSFTLCNSGFMYENTADSNPQTNIFCGISAVNWSYYRVKPEETSTSEESSSTSSSSPRSTPANPTAASATASSTADPEAEPQKKEESKAWIAGAVVGPIAGLAILGLLLWFCLIRKKKKNNNAANASVPPSVPPQSYPGSPNQGPPAPYYPPMQQNNNSGFVPYGVGVSDPKHQSWAQPPHSPHSNGSHSPYPPNSPNPPPAMPQQQWSPVQQSGSPPPQGGEDFKHPHEQAPGQGQGYTSELDGGMYQPQQSQMQQPQYAQPQPQYPHNPQS